MSLRVWLPLNGDLRNQGLNNYQITILGTIAFPSSGKIGKCFQAGNGTQVINGLRINSNLTDILAQNYSIAVWVKPLGNHVHYNGTIISSGNWNKIRWAFGVSQDNTKVDVLCNGYNTYINCEVPVNTWTHLICIRTSDGKVSLYKNGEYINFITRSDHPQSDTNVTTIGRETYANGYFSFNGCINDVRIYDHALSEQEIKKIAQGLILHYPLNNRGMGQENLLKNSNFDARYNQSTGWNVAKNGTLLANYWGGYNSGVTNASTVYHAHLKEFNNDYVYEFIKTSDEQWLGIWQSGLQNIITAGKTYTFSWEEYHVNGTNRVATGLYYYKINATSANFHLGLIQRSDIVRIIGKWQKFSYTFVAPNDADYNKSMIWYVYGHYNNNGTFYVRHLKLEEGDKATSWSLNSSDDLYTTLQLNDNNVKDISGFNNNAEYVNDFTFNSDTPIYKIGTIFNHTNNYIIGESPTAQARTITCWIKFYERGNQVVFIDYKSGCSFGIFNTYIPVCNKNTSYRTCYNRDIFEANVWYFIAVVRNDTDQKIDLYVNGEKQTPVSSTDYWSSNVSDKLALGARTNGTTLFNGQMSDFRIYATALSVDDIKELYEYRS